MDCNGMEQYGIVKITTYAFFSYSSNALQEAIFHHVTGC